MAIPEWKTGDTTPDIGGQLTDNDGPVDISGATSVKFIAVCDARVDPIEGTCDVPAGASGLWSYTWGASDLDTAGTYFCEIEVTWTVGKIQTFPNNKERNPSFVVTEDLG
jgi:hypothetical protein